MSVQSIKNTLGNIDIYLLDQLLKERYSTNDKLLDAGCGYGRNMHWFYENNYTIYGLDRDAKCIDHVHHLYPNIKENLLVSTVDHMPYDDCFFDHVISSAVLHFAESTAHFEAMFSELLRVLKVGGSLFIRMTSNIGIENSVTKISDGVYTIPDGTTRFLITKKHLSKLMKTHHLSFLEPLKTVNVNDKRCMTTLVLKKLK